MTDCNSSKPESQQIGWDAITFDPCPFPPGGHTHLLQVHSSLCHWEQGVRAKVCSLEHLQPAQRDTSRVNATVQLRTISPAAQWASHVSKTALWCPPAHAGKRGHADTHSVMSSCLKSAAEVRVPVTLRVISSTDGFKEQKHWWKLSGQTVPAGRSVMMLLVRNNKLKSQLIH